MSIAKYTEPITHASRETLMSILETLPGALFFIDDSGTIVSANASALALTGAPSEEVIGKPLVQTLWLSCSSASQEQVRAAIARANKGETVHFETMIHPWEGKYLDLEATITLHVDANNHSKYLVFAGVDITARKSADAEIRSLIDAIPHLVWTRRPDSYVDYTNQRWRDYTGLSIQQSQGDGWLQAIHPDDQQRILALWQSAVQIGRPYEAELRLRQGTTGAYRWFLIKSVPYKDAQGTILKYVGTCTDIDEQKRAEQQLKASEENWRVLAETVPQLVWTTRPDGRLDYVNHRYCDVTQTDVEHLRDYGWCQFLHPEDAEGVVALRQHTLETGEPFESEHRLRNGQTGTYRWFLVRALPVRDETGQIVKWFGTNTDIEERKRIEEALRQSQARVRALIDSNLIGITSYEWEGEVTVEANEAFLQMTGYTQEDIDRRTLTRARMTLPEDAPLFERSRQELAAHGQHTPLEFELVCKDGSRLPILAGGVLFQDHPRQFVTFMLDNSARKELEQRKDAFISMASHELRNPLAALKLQTALLKRKLAKQGSYDPAAALSKMEAQVNIATGLVEELLDVSKIQAGRLEYAQEPVDLDALLQEIAETMQQINPSHTLVVRGAVQTSLLGDRDRLGQVFTNLISNAIKYSPDAETVEIDLSASPETVTIRVHDHGIGIPREQRDKIFERFYRAAGPKQRAIPGLGMGLYIVAEIIKRHGGTITVESEVGKGSTFQVTLPRKRDA
ncbi:MAG: PAS domain S-box protein [Ktedonobacteraceae bacterium]